MWGNVKSTSRDSRTVYIFLAHVLTWISLFLIFNLSRVCGNALRLFFLFGKHSFRGQIPGGSPRFLYDLVTESCAPSVTSGNLCTFTFKWKVLFVAESS